MTASQIQIRGKVIDRDTGEGVSELHVEARDVDRYGDDFVGSAETDEQGKFEMTIEQSDFDDIFDEQAPDLYFTISYHGEHITDTSDSVLWNSDEPEANIVIEIDEQIPPYERLFRFSVTDSLALYVSPDDDAETVTTVIEDDLVDVLQYADDWYEVATEGGFQGWVRADSMPVLQQAIAEFTKPVSAPLIDSRRLQPVYDAISQLSAVNEDTRDRYRDIVDRLYIESEILNIVAQDAHSYLRGDPNAEERLRNVLSASLDTGGTTVPPTANRHQIMGDQPRGPTPGPMPGGPSDVPCLFEWEPFFQMQLSLIRLSHSLGAPDPAAMESIYREFSSNIDGPMESARLLEFVYQEAHVAGPQGLNDPDRFRAILDSAANSGQIPTESNTVDGDQRDRNLRPDGAQPQFDFIEEIIPEPTNLCQEERAGRTERAVKCACFDSYEIDRISNLSQTPPDDGTYIGEACPGDRIAIKGRGFGRNRDWGLDSQKSEVVFQGSEVTYRDGMTGVPATEYDEWSDTRVEVTVPEESQPGPILMRILCDGINVSKCGIQLKPVVGDVSNRRVAIPEPPTIDTALAQDRDGIARDRFEACEPVSLFVVASNAEQVKVLDEDGDEIEFPAGVYGERREIRGETESVRTPESATYTVHASNVCHEIAESVSPERFTGIDVAVEPAVVTPGESATLVLRNFCEPEMLNLDEVVVDISLEATVGTTTDQHRNAIDGLPDRATFNADDSRLEFDLTANDACTELAITGEITDVSGDGTDYDESEDYDEPADETLLEVYDTPQIHRVETMDSQACDPLRFTVHGDCFYPRLESTESLSSFTPRNEVVVEGSDHGPYRFGYPPHRSADKPRITDITLGDGIPWHGMTLVCEAPDGLLSDTYDVTVELRPEGHPNLSSDPVPLLDGDRLGYPEPEIHVFSPTPAVIDTGAYFHTVTFRWVVTYTDYVEIENLTPRNLGDKPGSFHVPIDNPGGERAVCQRWEDTLVDDEMWGDTQYELRAYNGDAASPTTATLTVKAMDMSGTGGTTRLPGLPRANLIRIYNCNSPPVDADPDDDSDRHATGSNEIRVRMREIDGMGRRARDWHTVDSVNGNETLPPALRSGRTCPSPSDDKIRIDLTDGHQYDILVEELGRRGTPDYFVVDSGSYIGDSDASNIDLVYR